MTTTEMTTKTEWDKATQAIRDAKTVLVVSHVSPDGDAVGSLLGATNMLKDMGKTVTAVLDDGVPEFLEFLPNADSVVKTLKKGEWDVMLSVDASDDERTGKAGEYGRENSKIVINLDHHPTNTFFGDIHLVMPTAVSATEIIYRWIDSMPDYQPSLDVAKPLLTGLVTDTIGFRTSNVTAQTLIVATKLMEVGASLTEITERTLGNRSINAIYLWKDAFSTVELHEGGVIAANITQEALKKAGYKELTDAGLVGFLNRVKEAMIAVVFKEISESSVEISLRCKPGFDISVVAFALGGGGHKQASGATIEGSLDEVRKKVLPMLIEASRKGKLVIA